MSTLVVSNISDGTTTVGASYVTNGSAKAWVLFNMNPTSLTASLNVSSISDNGTGQSTVTLTNAMSGTNDYNTPASDSYYGMCNAGESGGRTASSFNVYDYDTNGNNVDINNISVAVHGDLA